MCSRFDSTSAKYRNFDAQEAKTYMTMHSFDPIRVRHMQEQMKSVLSPSFEYSLDPKAPRIMVYRRTPWTDSEKESAKFLSAILYNFSSASIESFPLSILCYFLRMFFFLSRTSLVRAFSDSLFYSLILFIYMSVLIRFLRHSVLKSDANRPRNQISCTSRTVWCIILDGPGTRTTGLSTLFKYGCFCWVSSFRSYASGSYSSSTFSASMGLYTSRSCCIFDASLKSERVDPLVFRKLWILHCNLSLFLRLFVWNKNPLFSLYQTL